MEAALYSEKGRRDDLKLTKSELEIMTVLWKAARPLSRGEILSLSEEKTWKDNSIHILLNGMLKKEAIREDGYARSGKVWGRLYAPNCSMEEYYAENLFAKCGQDNLLALFSALIRSESVTPELLDSMEALLQARKKELK